MSIINDALKKTQMSFKKKDASAKKEEPQKEEPKEPSNVYEKLYKKQAALQEASRAAKGQPAAKQDAKASEPGPAKNWIKTVGVTLLVLALIGTGLYFASKQEAVQDMLSSLKAKGMAAKSQFNRPTPKKRSYRPGELVLNGTSLIDGKRVALINDEIYQVGEVVDGKTITHIDLNLIELKDDETVTTLRVH